MEQRYNTSSIDLQELYDYCKQHGKVVIYKKGKRLEQEGEPAQWFAFVKKGCFKYMVRSLNGKSEYITWFSFKGEIASCYPDLLYGRPARFTIEAMTNCTVLRINSEQLLQFFNQNAETKEFQILLSDHLLSQFETRYTDHYRATPRERYELLLRRCPGIMNDLPLTAIASFLKVTPTYLSIIRKEITFDDKLPP